MAFPSRVHVAAWTMWFCIVYSSLMKVSYLASEMQISLQTPHASMNAHHVCLLLAIDGLVHHGSKNDTKR